MARALKNSTWPVRLPTKQRMSAVPHSEDDNARTTRLARWAADHDFSPSPGAWLLGASHGPASELADLKERLAEAERRAEDAEAALPHLLALGQRTVNGLLSDARLRSRQIIEDARQQATLELENERLALQREASELDALRLAVACEAMGLEQIRNELEAGIAALQLGDGSTDPTAHRQLPVGSVPVIAADPAAPMLPPPPSPADLVSVGMTANAATPPKDSPSGRFADAWAAGEDEMMVEAFDRFFAAEISRDPLRDAVVDDTDPATEG